MRKFTLLAALVLGAAGATQAQTTGVQFGLKAGLSEAVLDGALNQDANFKTGAHFGGFLRWRPSARVALQPELVFSQQGSSNKIPLSVVTLENKTKLNYLNIPVLLKVYLGDVVNLQVGPQFGLLMSAHLDGQTGYTSSSNGNSYRVENVDQKDFYKGDIGLCGGLGVDLKNGLLFAARLNYGLTDITKDENTKKMRDYFGIGGLHNRVIEASVGYAFGSK
ncbi:porin family protein [Hymenobacter wooponensis]|uniref:PorT family protein n=1 Tax=Hymenobacter wooponensis TaxID=1525360 RepID=A0A4Z0MGX8_9BACT|nr:porin family protein [Hymenobacter wooponensis]TGD78465.1 PorT family protein [Hymenobacter wooponensis]